MTDKEMAIAIARRVILFQTRELAAETLFSQLRKDGKSIPWQAQLERDVVTDLAPEGPFGQWLSETEHALEESDPASVLETLYRELFDRS